MNISKTSAKGDAMNISKTSAKSALAILLLLTATLTSFVGNNNAQAVVESWPVSINPNPEFIVQPLTAGEKSTVYIEQLMKKNNVKSLTATSSNRSVIKILSKKKTRFNIMAIKPGKSKVKVKLKLKKPQEGKKVYKWTIPFVVE